MLMVRKVMARALMASVAAGLAVPAMATEAPDAATLAKMFGSRDYVRSISLSPDGKSVVFITPGPGKTRIVAVADTGTNAVTPVTRTTGEPLNVTRCGWASNDRLVCSEYGIDTTTGEKVDFTRTVAFDRDGKHPIFLALPPQSDALRISQNGGQIVDWLSGADGNILMTRDYVPQDTLKAGAVASKRDGLGVDRIDARTGRSQMIEQPTQLADAYLTDGEGHVRMMETVDVNPSGIMTGTSTWLYRMPASSKWQIFSRIKNDSYDALDAAAVDGAKNSAYALRSLNGRQALYSVALDGSMKTELVASSDRVDVDGPITLGRHGRVIGASYETEKPVDTYFDPAYKSLAAALGRALPATPLIRFISASADENVLLVFAGSDADPGHFYTFDRTSHQLHELFLARPELENLPLATEQSISYPAADGTMIPAYLTLPPGGARKDIPAIVMPHGGPGDRDSWGFDWLAQFYAQRGFAVIQPEFRGSAGYGNLYNKNNGFQSWRTSIGDVTDAGRFLVKQGIADPAKLAIVGWSYGGYAALQANVVDPKLFKAVVAIAPVTDFTLTKNQYAWTSAEKLIREQIGSGQATEGSPDYHANKFEAPVLMFHGDHDLNVDIGQSRAMDAALHRAGKQSTLVVFPGLDHQLEDGDARARLLEQSDEFLRAALKL